MADTDRPDLSLRLAALRTELAARSLDGFLVPLTDEHMSEYVGDYARRLEWLTGFKGSAATAVVLRDGAAIFTDGRYTQQVRQQVAAEDWDFVGLPQSGVAEWLVDHAPSGARIGYDPWLHTAREIEQLQNATSSAYIAVATNPIDAIWSDRPRPSPAPIVVQPDACAGESSAPKRAEIARTLTAEGLETTVMTALDSIAWTFNLRGTDVVHTPVGRAFATVHADGTADLFVAPGKIDPRVSATLGNSVRMHDYDAFADYLATLAGKPVAIDPERAVAAVSSALTRAGATIVARRDPAVLAKAMKNSVEQAGARAAHLRDGIALTAFLHWLSSEGPAGSLTEIEAADRLQAFRAAGGALRDLSFDTISGAGPNGAIMHYRVDAASNRRIDPSSVYLVDSGGQYDDGTTDVTRTLWIGPGLPPAEVRDRFTRVLKGHIALATLVFPDGTSGGQIDAFARAALWQAGLDYAHGTGHGVGSYLAVHEGPQRIAKSSGAQSGTGEPLRAGMIVSNEPGYYKPGAYGIRIENLLLIEPRAIAGAEHAMLGFENLTLAPLDRAMIEPALLTDVERHWLDDYHANVLARLGPQLAGHARTWLAAACRPLD